MPGQARILTQTEIRDLFKLLGNNRDQALFALGIYTGLRIGEIIAIKYSQVFTKDGGTKNVLKVVRQKTKQRVYSDIPIHPKLRDRLLKYKKELDDSAGKNTWLFPSADSSTGHLERVRAHYILRSAFDRLHLEDASTHSNAPHLSDQHEPCRRAFAHHSRNLRPCVFEPAAGVPGS